MDDQTIKDIVAEIEPLLNKRAPGKIFQLAPLSFAIDFRLRDDRYLLLGVEPALPRLHLVKRRVRDLEKQKIAPTHFALTLRKELAGTTLRSVEKDARDRVVRFLFAGVSELGEAEEHSLVAQLTGRSANLFLLDASGVITGQARSTHTPGQRPDERYRAPTPRARTASEGESELLQRIRSNQSTSASEVADLYYGELISRQAFEAKASAARAELRKQIARQKKLLEQLHKDLASHADAEEHKHLGDLLLANLSTAKRTGDRVNLIDYFSPNQAEIEIEVDQKVTLAQEASRRFALFARSKRAVRQINSRIEAAQKEADALDAQREQLENLIAEGDIAALEPFLAGRGGASKRLLEPSGGRVDKKEKKIPGTRRYVSSDGFEILVGRRARDNDLLTFKVARPNDLWLHAADYPGSHVVVRNSTRKEIPHRTIIEAAQLAAYFSQARKDQKVDIHYTPRKFLAKPKGAAPGLVRLSRFKNITVEPRSDVERVDG